MSQTQDPAFSPPPFEFAPLPRIIAAIIIAFVAGGIAHAEFKPVGGGWFLQTEADAFTDQLNVVGMRANKEGSSVGLRCLTSGLSIAILPNGKSLKEGDSYDVSLRVDHQQIFEMTGTAINESFIEVGGDQMSELMKQVRDGQQLAIRTVGASVNTMIFSLANVAKVMTPLLKACPLNAAPKNKGDPL